MSAYADTSFLARIYLTATDSAAAVAYMQTLREPLPFTVLQHHELRNAIRLAVFRKEITAARRDAAFADVESDLAANVLNHTPLHWANVWREAERLSATHTETLGVRSLDILHVAAALTLETTDFLSFDQRQRVLAKAERLRVKP